MSLFEMEVLTHQWLSEPLGYIVSYQKLDIGRNMGNFDMWYIRR